MLTAAFAMAAGISGSATHAGNGTGPAFATQDVSLILGNGNKLVPTGVEVPTVSGAPVIVLATAGRTSTGGVLNGTLAVYDGAVQRSLLGANCCDPTGIAAGDINGDGSPDVVLASAGSGSTPPSFETWNTSSGSFVGGGGGTAGNQGDGGGKPALGDLNGDGANDVVVPVPGSGRLIILPGAGTAPSRVINTGGAQLLSVGSSPQAVAVADVNGDGHADLLVAEHASGDIGVLLGNGDLTFQPAVQVPACAGPQDIAASDLNGDGLADVAVACDTGLVAVLRGDGDGTFQAAVDYTTGIGTRALRIADMNNDGHPDIVAVSSADGMVWSLYNPGDGTFPAVFSTALTAGAQPWALAVADLDGDGIEDVVVADHGTVAFTMLTQSSLPNVTLGVTASGTSSTAQAAPATVTADGTSTSTITVRLDDGSGNPVAGKTVTLGPSGGSSTIATLSGTTDANGVATFSVKDAVAQTVTYTATDTTDGVTVTQTATVAFTAVTTVATVTAPIVAPSAPPPVLQPVRINLTAGNPVASFTYAPLVVATGVPVSFTSTATDSTEPITITTWAFGDGGSATGPTVEHGFPQAGTFMVAMTVRDLAGATANITEPVLVVAGTLHVSPAAVPANGTTYASLSFALTGCGQANCPGTAMYGAVAVNGSSTLQAVGGTPLGQLEQIQASGTSVSGEILVRDAVPETVTYLVTVIWGGEQQSFTAQVAFTSLAAAGKSTVRVLTPTTLPANGKTGTTALVTLRDAAGNPLGGKQLTLVPVLAAGPHAGMPAHVRSAANVTTNAQGTARVHMTDAWPERAVIGALDTTDGISVEPTTAAARNAATAHFTAALGVAAARSTIATTSTAALSASPPGPTVTVLLRNAQGGAVPGRAVVLQPSTTSARTSPASVTTDADGAAQFTVTDGNSETVGFSAVDSTDKISLPQQVSVRFVDHVADAGTSTLSADRTSILADAFDSSRVTVTLRDAAGNPVASDQVSLHASGGHSTVAPATASTDRNGVATFVVIDGSVETETYTAVAVAGSGHLVDVAQTVTLTFTTPQPVSATASVVSTSTFGTVPDDQRGFRATLAVTVDDAAGVPVADVAIRAVAPLNPPFYPNGDGTYTPGYENTSSGTTGANGVVDVDLVIRSVVCFTEGTIEVGILPQAATQTLNTPWPPSSPWLGAVSLPCLNRF